MSSKTKTGKKPAEDVDVPAEVNDDDNTDETEPKETTTKTKNDKPNVTAKEPAKKTRNPETEQKRRAEKERVKQAFDYVINDLKLLQNDISELATRYQDKLASEICTSILSCIRMIQQSEVRNETDRNPFPAKLFILEDKKTDRKKASVKSSTGKASVPMRKQSLIKKPKGKDKEEPVEEEAPDDSETHEANGANGANGEAVAAAEQKEEHKKTIASFTRGGKTMLVYLIMRYIDELENSPGSEKIKSQEDYAKFVNEGIIGDFKYHVSKHVLATVTRLSKCTTGLPEGDVIRNIFKDFEKEALFAKRMGMLRYANEALSEYIKLISYTLAQQLWVSRKGINQSMIEMSIRMLDMGNQPYFAENGICGNDGADYGLNLGFYSDANLFDSVINPRKPPSGAPKKKSAKKSKTTKKEEPAEEPADEEPADEENEEEEPEEEQEEEQEEDEEPKAKAKTLAKPPTKTVRKV